MMGQTELNIDLTNNKVLKLHDDSSKHVLIIGGMCLIILCLKHKASKTMEIVDVFHLKNRRPIM